MLDTDNISLRNALSAVSTLIQYIESSCQFLRAGGDIMGTNDSPSLHPAQVEVSITGTTTCPGLRPGYLLSRSHVLPSVKDHALLMRCAGLKLLLANPG